MKKLHFKDRSYEIKTNQSVLDILLQNGHRINWSCLSGFCHSCIMQTLSNTAPPPCLSQTTLTQDQIRENLFLACQCYPETDLFIIDYKREYQIIKSVIIKIETIDEITKEVCIQLQHAIDFSEKVVCIRRSEASAGSCYTILNLDKSDQKFHNVICFRVIRKLDDGVSRWIFDAAAVGDKLLAHLIDQNGDRC